jgi:2,4-dienoyl-CoA reductase-like NADH-dependent reductase (Old Yellow Enzyme family)
MWLSQSTCPFIGPSALAFGGDLTKVQRPMGVADIARVQGEFVAAAERSLAAGCERLELHAAHGYLIHWPRLAARALGRKDAVSVPVQYAGAW